MVGKNSLNLDSGKIASTFFTFWGLLVDPGLIVSTKVFLRVQDVVSLNAWISGVNGSEELTPHSVPEQDGELWEETAK